MEDRLTDLERRLARAERREGVTRCLALAGAAGVILLLTARPATTQNDGITFRAPLKVVDAQNRPMLDVVSLDGRSALRLYNRAGETVAGLADTGGGGAVGVYTRKGLPAVMLDGSREGGRVLVFNREVLKQVGELSATEKGGAVTIRNRAGSVVFAKP